MEGTNFQDQQSETSRHLNKVNVKGVLLSSVEGSTKTGINYANVLLEVRGKKYTETIPCVAYGPLVKQVLSAKKGDVVAVYGRLRSKSREDQDTHAQKISLTFICEQFDIIK